MVLYLVLEYRYVFGENESFIPVHIDGFNTLLFNQEYPNKSLSMYSIVYGNPLDSFPFHILSDSYRFSNIHNKGYDSLNNTERDSLFRMQVSGLVGSETGDPMLNRFEGLSHQNRDHFTNIVSSCSFPKTPLSIYFGYRYIDNYSDRFDWLWQNYKNTTGYNMSFYEEGLSYEVFGGYHLSGSVAATTLKTINYKRWGTTPFFFSPIFTTGYTLMPSLIFILPNSTLHLDFLYDYHKDYYNHIDYTEDSEYSDNGWEIAWKKRLQKGVYLTLSHCMDTKLTPSSYISTMLKDTVSNLFIWVLKGNFYSNLRPGASLDINYIQLPKFSIHMNAAWDYIQKQRDYTFLENETPVDYCNLDYETTNLHTDLVYTDTLFFPVSLSIWYDYCQKPLWEKIIYGEDRIIIKQDTISNGMCSTFGGKGRYKLSYKRLSLTLWGNAIITPRKKIQRFSLPRDMGADLGFGSPDNDSIYIAVRLESRDRASIKYRDENIGSIIEFTSPAQTSMYLLCKVPFLFPFFKEHIKINLQVEAGPIRFSKEKRLKEHPLGNNIGPAISFGLNGFIN